MIKINLLPQELRQTDEVKHGFSFQTALIGGFFVLLVVSFIELLFYQGIRHSIHRIDSEMKSLREPGEAFDRIAKTVNQDLIPHQKFLHQFIIAKVYIAEVMNELSNLLPDSMWLAQAKMRRDGESLRLDLSGFSFVTSNQIALAQIQEYINSVKSKLTDMANPPNSQNASGKVRNVNAVFTTSRKELGKTEVMQFDSTFQLS